MNFLLTLAYDGTNYCGFQVQPNGRSVAAAFQDALEAVLGTRPDIKGCSRTDAGVHALGFMLNFHADTRIPPEKLPLALNQHLPPDIRVLAARVVPEDFHARYAAHTKTYLYRIHNHPIDSPFDAAYYTRMPKHLDEVRMQAAARKFVGRHDFLALCAAGSSAAAHGDTVRTITDCHVTRRGDEIDIEVTADGYLYNMVRILAGTLCEVGAGRMQPEEIPGILASCDRSQAGPTLPAKGLFLKCVEYPDMLKNNWIKYLVQTMIALILSLIIMNLRGAFDSELAAADRFKGVCDGFSVTAMLYISFGILMWISTTGFFDIFGYAFRKGAHAIIPGMGLDRSNKSYYDYKQDKMDKRNTKPMYSTLIIGVLFLIISAILVARWYSL